MLSRVMALCILSAICVPALAQGELAELKKLRALCGHEIRTLCKGVEPGGGQDQGMPQEERRQSHRRLCESITQAQGRNEEVIWFPVDLFVDQPESVKPARRLSKLEVTHIIGHKE